MNNPNPLVPQGSLQGKTRAKANFRLAVFTILAIHVVLLVGLLMQGCKNKDELASANAKTNELAFPTKPPTNDFYPANPVSDLASQATPPQTGVTASNPPPAEVQTPPTASTVTTEYSVVRNDSFSRIAKAKGVTVKAIADANPGVDSTKLKIGQKLQIPAPSSDPVATGLASAPAKEAAGREAATATYVVKAGDSLTRIAVRNGTTVKALRTANHLRTDQIRVGQKLVIPTGKSAESKPISPVASSTTSTDTAVQ